MTPTPTTDAPDPVRVAVLLHRLDEAATRSYLAIGHLREDCRDAAALIRAMQEAISAQVGGEALRDAFDSFICEGIKDADRKRASIGLISASTAEDEAAGRIAAYQAGYQNGRRATLQDAAFVMAGAPRPAPEVKDAPEAVPCGFERCADCGGSGMYWAGEDVRPCPECKGDTVVRTTPAPAASDEHPDDIAVDRFAAAMKAKLAKKRAEGYGGWEDQKSCSNGYLSQLLVEHVKKGDPVDIGNLAMMLHQRGEVVADDRERYIAKVERDRLAEREGR